MAYGLKYYLDYCNSSGLGCTVNIYEDGWEGDGVELTGQPVPFRKTYTSGSDFKFEPIRPSTAEVFLVFGMDAIDFDEFWTADERKFKVEHIIGMDVDWVGFVIPNGFGYQLTGGLYYAELRAADGLSTLRD